MQLKSRLKASQNQENDQLLVSCGTHVVNVASGFFKHTINNRVGELSDSTLSLIKPPCG